MALPLLKCKVISNHFITPTVFSLKFETNPTFEYLAGQFISIIIPGAGPQGRNLRRAYSIASTPQIHPNEICVKLVEKGPGTNYLVKLKAGDFFEAQAPFGDFIYKTNPEKEVVFIATGTGISPFRSILASKKYRENPALKSIVLFGVRTEDELLYTNELQQTAQLLVNCVSRPQGKWSGFHGRVSDYLKKNADKDFHLKNSDFYMCGNGEMIQEVKDYLISQDVSKDSIHQEKYY